METDLADGSAKGQARIGDRLHPVLADAPVPGDCVEVARGVRMMRLPLPFQLDHVNVYLLDDGEGWTVVDAGLRLAEARAMWDAALGGRPIRRVICTHMHPDHIGLAGWLCARNDAALLMSRLEYVTARMLLAETEASAEGETFYRAAGWDAAQLARWREGFGGFAKGVDPLPAAFTRLEDGDVLTIGGDEWTVVVGSGHSPEHICLWRKSDDVFLAGDQVLPRISSNVSVWPTEPAADPLGDWLASLDKLRGLLPEETVVLPAHGDPFTGVRPRLEALNRGHEVALKRLERTLRKPTRVIDAFPAVFGRTVGDAVLGMATGEAQAHLNYLERRGRARRSRDEGGVDWWTAAARDEDE